MRLPKVADLAMGRSFHDFVDLPPYPRTESARYADGLTPLHQVGTPATAGDPGGGSWRVRRPRIPWRLA
ncbi:MAG: hypothetical protein JWO93_2072 [Micrococcaceae bacterium]|nr:hypothetical protein [Micrococcaceae bacterium]